MKKLENFIRALNNLSECFNYKEPFDAVTTTGLVGLYDICFEQAWKAMKEILEQHGYDASKTRSPRMVIKLAYSAGMIDNEEIWLEALSARNNAAHAYNEAIAISIINDTKNKFYDMFLRLKNEIKRAWI
ncbi:MAG: HI0074 family nucleotidyltransferase substrate-binding subunit [Candidatus Ornithomonoglobus sp.]